MSSDVTPPPAQRSPAPPRTPYPRSQPLHGHQGLTFIGPTVQNLDEFGDKTSARKLAIASQVPVVPGTPGPVTNLDQAKAFCAECGFPVIIKASMGGGGKGMRVVMTEADLPEMFERASSEALAAFGCGDVFIERFVKDPRHIEVQILGDVSFEGQGREREQERDSQEQHRTHSSSPPLVPIPCT